MRNPLPQVAATLDQEVFQRLQLTTPAVFLVGAGRSAPSTLRDQIRDELVGRKWVRGFDVYYPEELFEELLWEGERHAGLLELENKLAENVHAVVIVLESEGPIAELGAFANHEKLRDRLVVIVNRRHRKSRSFIMLGPVAYLKQETRSEIIYHEPKNPDMQKLGEQIRSAVRKISKEAVVDTTVQNSIAAQHYLRAAIHVLHPVSEDVLISLVQHVGPSEHAEANRIVSTALSILRSETEVTLGNDGYELTQPGKDRLRKMLEREKYGRNISEALDKARIDILTWTIRKRQKLTA